MPELKAGDYAYHFEGTAMKNRNEYRLMGVGTFALAADGTINGKHRYSLVNLASQEQKLLSGAYSTSGKIAIDQGGDLSASVDYIRTVGTTSNMNGKYHVVVAGEGRLWFVSAGAALLSANGLPDGPDQVEMS